MNVKDILSEGEQVLFSGHDVQRDSALTAKSKILKESTLRDHAGWTMTSKMPNIYLHYFGNESSKSLLEAYGVEKYNQPTKK